MSKPNTMEPRGAEQSKGKAKVVGPAAKPVIVNSNRESIPQNFPKTNMPIDKPKRYRQKWEQDIEHHMPEHMDKGAGNKRGGGREFKKGENDQYKDRGRSFIK